MKTINKLIIILSVLCVQAFAQTPSKIKSIVISTTKIDVVVSDVEHFNSLKDLTDLQIEQKYKSIEGILDFKLLRNTNSDIMASISIATIKTNLGLYLNISKEELAAKGF